MRMDRAFFSGVIFTERFDQTDCRSRREARVEIIGVRSYGRTTIIL